MNERFLDAEQQAQILARASELQDIESSSERDQGVTLEDLERTALERGLDSRHVRRAAREAGITPSSTPSAIWPVASTFALCQFIAWSGLIYGEAYTAAGFAILATLVLAATFSRNRRDVIVGLALLVGSTLAAVLTTLLWRTAAHERELVVGVEDNLWYAFFAQVLVFAAMAAMMSFLRHLHTTAFSDNKRRGSLKGT
ncbi:hypothetical protein EON81_12430 [bacterium]|nr:MAG: hypothetical protein EON81_12430 [bacterium]